MAMSDLSRCPSVSRVTVEILASMAVLALPIASMGATGKVRSESAIWGPRSEAMGSDLWGSGGGKHDREGGATRVATRDVLDRGLDKKSLLCHKS